MISLAALHTPTRGRESSSLVSPVANIRERCGAFSNPWVMSLLRMRILVGCGSGKISTEMKGSDRKIVTPFLLKTTL
jgi:hypothetical protein